MKLNIILFLSCVIQLYAKDYSINYSISRLRNTFLRLSLSQDVLQIKNYCNKIYNKGLSTYYKINEYYYSLSNEEKILFNTIIALCY